MNTLAVIDIGSNTVKSLVARRGADGALEALRERALETRLARNLGADGSLDGEARAAVADAAAQLLEDARLHGAQAAKIVATSAVRGAPNARDFCDEVRARTGLKVRVLSGEEEAALIARGISTEPGLRDCPAFNAADLGGGSLECMRVENGRLARAFSAPLGAVRLTRAFAPETRLPAPPDLYAHVEARVRECVNGFSFLKGAPFVVCGGAFAAARACLNVQDDRARPATLALGDLEDLRSQLCALGAEARCARFPALSKNRADIMPAALCAAVALLRAAGAKRALHALRNLRYGVADAALPALARNL